MSTKEYSTQLTTYEDIPVNDLSNLSDSSNDEDEDPGSNIGSCSRAGKFRSMLSMLSRLIDLKFKFIPENSLLLYAILDQF